MSADKPDNPEEFEASAATCFKDPEGFWECEAVGETSDDEATIRVRNLDVDDELLAALEDEDPDTLAMAEGSPDEDAFQFLVEADAPLARLETTGEGPDSTLTIEAPGQE